MATYEYSYNSGTSAYQYKLLDHQMYGMGRVGTYNINEILVNSQEVHPNDASKQFFELTDYLGSVRAVVSGVKTSGNATIVQLTDYHEFGQTMQGRNFVSQQYRFGYQGSEHDGEVDGGAYTTEFRALDVRLGRWMSPDPIIHEWQTPYCSMDNNPINLTDIFGLAGDPPTGTGDHTSNPNGTAGGPKEGEQCQNEDGSGESYLNGEWHSSQLASINNLLEIETFSGSGVVGTSVHGINLEIVDMPKPSDDDYTGLFQNATPEMRESEPFRAWLRDFSLGGLDFLGLNAIDNCIATFNNPAATVSDKALAVIVMGISTPGKGPKEKGPKIKTQVEVKVETKVIAKGSASKLKYSPTKKHQKGGWGTEMNLKDEEAGHVLENSIQSGNQRYGIKDGQVYEFQPDNTGGWHGYPVKGTEAPPNVLREFQNRGEINKAEYNRLIKGK